MLILGSINFLEDDMVTYIALSKCIVKNIDAAKSVVPEHPVLYRSPHIIILDMSHTVMAECYQDFIHKYGSLNLMTQILLDSNGWHEILIKRPYVTPKQYSKYDLIMGLATDSAGYYEFYRRVSKNHPGDNILERYSGKDMDFKVTVEDW